MAWLDDVWAVHSTSDRMAMLDESGSVTGRRLIGKAMCAAEWLTSLEPRPGGSVPALLTTNSDSLALLLGGAAANRPIAPMGARSTAAELARMVRSAAARVIVTESRSYDLAVGAAALCGGTGRASSRSLRHSSAQLPQARGDVAFVLHTSGTTGEPKRVPFPEDVLAARVAVSANVIGLRADHRYATGSPLHHIAGLGNVLTALSVGAPVLPTTQFSVDWWRGLRDAGATHCLLVPTMIEMLLAQRVLDVVPLRTLIYGAAPMSPETLRRVLHTLPAVGLVSIFGQTEGSPITTLDADDHARAAAGRPDLLDTVGRAAQGTFAADRRPRRHGHGRSARGCSPPVGARRGRLAAHRRPGCSGSRGLPTVVGAAQRHGRARR